MTQSEPIELKHVAVTVADGPLGPVPKCPQEIDITQYTGVQFKLATSDYVFGKAAIHPNDGKLALADDDGDKRSLTLIDPDNCVGQWKVTFELVHASGLTLKHDPEIINKPRDDTF